MAVWVWMKKNGQPWCSGFGRKIIDGIWVWTKNRRRLGLDEEEQMKKKKNEEEERSEAA
jgi:hypothetical protein